MRTHPFKRIIAVVLLVAVAVMAGNGLCFARDTGHALETSCGTADEAAARANCGGDAPCCPDEDESSSDHCGSCLSCPCHAPLNSQGALLSYSPLVISLSFPEHLNAPPDVYRPIFVPPQLTA